MAMPQINVAGDKEGQFISRTFVNILGTEYKIRMKTDEEEPYFQLGIADGYFSGLEKEITILNCFVCARIKDESSIYKAERMKDALRHEIVHAFLYESGLDTDSHQEKEAWARNEEMVDWIAKQGHKIHMAWETVGCLPMIMSPDNWLDFNASQTSSLTGET